MDTRVEREKKTGLARVGVCEFRARAAPGLAAPRPPLATTSVEFMSVLRALTCARGQRGRRIAGASLARLSVCRCARAPLRARVLRQIEVVVPGCVRVCVFGGGGGRGGGSARIVKSEKKRRKLARAHEACTRTLHRVSAPPESRACATSFEDSPLRSFPDTDGWVSGWDCFLFVESPSTPHTTPDPKSLICHRVSPRFHGTARARSPLLSLT